MTPSQLAPSQILSAGYPPARPSYHLALLFVIFAHVCIMVHNYRRCSCASIFRAVWVLWMSEVMASEVGVCHSPSLWCWNILWESARKWVGNNRRWPHQTPTPIPTPTPTGAEHFSTSDRDGSREIVRVRVHLSTPGFKNPKILSTLRPLFFVISSETWKRQMNYDWPGITNYTGPLQMGQKPLIRRTRGLKNNKTKT